MPKTAIGKDTNGVLASVATNQTLPVIYTQHKNADGSIGQDPRK